MDIRIVFGQVLREVRKSKGISQEQLALQASIDRSYISKLEQGQYQPTLATVFALSKILNCTPAELVNLVDLRLQESRKNSV
ncbi:helix-turn-helix domain-containing protein [Motiliproteus sp. MSK22-1]|uniref:helix-turn-helix domain-containing protein n=1 Tax=Motiliproteus sp. MSK22-1 TaxID=1897630 RepID=UPI0009768752|nr:hypothetical protein BGP75_22210 [Motiliproteus sp. MSK22-1]